MDGAFKDLMGKPTFKFIIGPERRDFFVHVSVLEKNSKVLKVLAQGPMSEAQEGQVVLEDCSEQVFERFCQFAYTGNYDYVKAGRAPSNDTVKTGDDGKGTQLKNESTESATTQSPAASVDFTEVDPTTLPPAIFVSANLRMPTTASSYTGGNRVVRLRTKQKRKNPTNPWNIFLNEEYGKSDVPFETPSIICDRGAYEIFFCHAELYVFADRYDIPVLRNMTLFRLHETLIWFHVFPERLSDLVKVIEYIYESTSEPASESGSDRLRELMAHFTFVTLEEFMENKHFVNNLLGLQPFMKDVMRVVLRTQHLLEYRVGRA